MIRSVVDKSLQIVRESARTSIIHILEQMPEVVHVVGIARAGMRPVRQFDESVDVVPGQRHFTQAHQFSATDDPLDRRDDLLRRLEQFGIVAVTFQKQVPRPISPLGMDQRHVGPDRRQRNQFFSIGAVDQLGGMDLENVRSGQPSRRHEREGARTGLETAHERQVGVFQRIHAAILDSAAKVGSKAEDVKTDKTEDDLPDASGADEQIRIDGRNRRHDRQVAQPCTHHRTYQSDWMTAEIVAANPDGIPRMYLCYRLIQTG